MISRPLRTTKGENTSAAWGVANFLLRLREKYDPDYVAWVNDAGSSFREERYPDYKSTREKLDEELQADFDRSVERIRELLAAFRIPLVTVQGYEADDVIATLATQAAGAGPPGGDRLRRQGLLPAHRARGGAAQPRTRRPRRCRGDLGGRENASERLGVSPSQVADYLALVGDSSDNIPGVKGVGEKGAQKLLAEYGDLDTILAQAPEITAKRTREALLAGADNARLSQELVTIKRDVPVELDLDAMRVGEPDFDVLRRILTELEFFSLAKKLQGQGGVADDARSRAPLARRPRVHESPGDPRPPPVAATATDSPQAVTVPVTAFSTTPPTSPPLSPGSARRRSSRSMPRLLRSSRTTPTSSASSLAASPTEIWYIPFSHRHRTAGELGLAERPPHAGDEEPARCSPLPPPRRCASCSRIRPSPRPDTTSSTTGRCCARRGRAARRRVRLDARELRPRSRAAAPTPSIPSASSTSARPMRTYQD